jgi:hypothetical protein
MEGWTFWLSVALLVSAGNGFGGLTVTAPGLALRLPVDLLASCTSISIGNGEIARFWTDRWLNGQAPKLLAPLCFTLAVRKNLTVKEALVNGRWMRGLQRMSNEE